MKTLIKTGVAITVLAGLAGCGLRGDLKTPPPIFSDPPTEEAQQPVDSPALFAASEIRDNLIYYNSLGGEIPKPAPDADVEEESMGEVSPG